MQGNRANPEIDDPVSGAPWTSPASPQRILLIRLQAIGDVVATLPAIAGLKRSLPGTRLDFLTRPEAGRLPSDVSLFDSVYLLHGGRNAYLQMLAAPWVAWRLSRKRYDVVVDLQGNRVSRWIRERLDAPAWSSFDRLSPLPHSVRVQRAIEYAVGRDAPLVFDLPLREPAGGLALLPEPYRDRDLVVLNPAGFFPTRNWALENYVAFAKAWHARHPNAAFVVLGDARIERKAAELERALPGRLLNLVGRTSVTEAFEILGRAALVVSEDSGLLHMAWTGGTPCVALFGSTRSDWSRPLGPHSALLDSSDLPCGNCMAAECRFGDVRCLARYTPEQVVSTAEELLAGLGR